MSGLSSVGSGLPQDSSYRYNYFLHTPTAFFHNITFIMQKYIPNFNPWDHLEDWKFMHVLLLLSKIKDINFFFF